MHIGSAKYYYQSDEQAPLDADWRRVAADLSATGRAQFEIRIDMGAAKIGGSP
jgi:hypothetical protein